MRVLSKMIIEALREAYPVGTRVVLKQMDDPQAPQIGTKGSVYGVDDLGNILVHWDDGSSLNIVYGVDLCQKEQKYRVYKTDGDKNAMKTAETVTLEKRIRKATLKMGTYGCFEVTIGYCGKERVDYMTYDTKGIFRCYEIKVSKADFHSTAAKSFVGHYNYYVLTQKLYNEVKEEIPDWIGVYVEDQCIKKAKKQDLSSREYKMRRSVNGHSTEISMLWVDMLKESMIRSLSRDSDKLFLIQAEGRQRIKQLEDGTDWAKGEDEDILVTPEELTESRQEYIAAATVNGVHPHVGSARQQVSFNAFLSMDQMLALMDFFKNANIEFQKN